jgi:hypothetical protein
MKSPPDPGDVDEPIRSIGGLTDRFLALVCSPPVLKERCEKIGFELPEGFTRGLILP